MIHIVTLAMLALVGFTVALTQVREHVLRQRAQLLLSDIRLLWMHVGTFADLQHLRQRWGTFGRYEGSCTAEHCGYSIILTSIGPPDWLTNDRLRRWTGTIFSLLGARDVSIVGSIIVHNDHMVLASFNVIFYVPPREGLMTALEDEGSGYELEARIRSASRLFRHGDGAEADLRREYEIGQPGACEGCVVGWVDLTPQTNVADVKRLTDINLDCITRFKPCENMDDLLPAAWSELRGENRDAHESPFAKKCSVSPALLAREADNVAVVEILKVDALKNRDEERTSRAAIRILEKLKNGDVHPAGSTASIAYGMENVYPVTGRKLAVEDRLILLYPRSPQGEIPGFIDTPFCSLIPLTDATLKSVREGIAMDPSGNDLNNLSMLF